MIDSELLIVSSSLVADSLIASLIATYLGVWLDRLLFLKGLSLILRMSSSLPNAGLILDKLDLLDLDMDSLESDLLSSLR